MARLARALRIGPARGGFGHRTRQLPRGVRRAAARDGWWQRLTAVATGHGHLLAGKCLCLGCDTVNNRAKAEPNLPSPAIASDCRSALMATSRISLQRVFVYLAAANAASQASRQASRQCSARPSWHGITAPPTGVFSTSQMMS